MKKFATKQDLKNNISNYGRRAFISVNELEEKLSVSETTARSLVASLTKFRFNNEGRKIWYIIDEVTEAVWNCRI